MRALFVLFVLVLTACVAVTAEAEEVEMEACEYTPEVKKELKLTPSQEPKLEKVFSDLAPRRKRIHETLQQRDQMIRDGATQEKIRIQTRKLVALEVECRQRSHELLRPVLSDQQFGRMLEMEELHRRRVTGQSRPVSDAPPPQ